MLHWKGVPANEVHELNSAQLERTGYPEKEIQSHYLEPVILEPYSYLLLIRLAAKAAPKPLSIFTTVTPLAQEFNIPNSAAIPPKEAP